MNNFFTKKNVYIAIILGILVIIAIFITFFKKTKLQLAKPKTILAQNVAFTTLNNNETKIFYFNEKDSRLKSVDLKTNKIEALYEEPFNNPYLIAWSPDKRKAVIGTSIQEDLNSEVKNFTIKNYIFDINSKDLREIGFNTLESVAWSQDNNEFAILITENNEDASKVIVLGVNGSEIKRFEQIDSFGAPLDLFWPTPSEIKVIKPKYFPAEDWNFKEEDAKSLIYNLNLTNGEITHDRTLTEYGQGTYSPNGAILLFNKAEGNQSYVLDVRGINPIDIVFDSVNSITWSKDSNKLYTMISSLKLQTDKPIGLYQVNIDSLTVEKLFDFPVNDSFGKSVYLDNLLLNSAGDTVYYTRQDVLYGLKIK